MRFIAAFFEIWVGIYVINLIYPEKKKFRMLPVLAAAVMGYFLYQSRMEHYISPKMVLVYTMATGVVMAIVKKKSLFKMASILAGIYLMICAIQILLSIGLISPADGLTYQLLMGIWPFTLALYVGTDIWILQIASVMKKYVEEPDKVIDKNYISILSIDMVLFFLIVFWREMVAGEGSFSYQAMGGFPIFIMLIGIIILILFADIISRFRGVEKEKETLLVREEIAKKQYEELAELISQNRQIVHDIKNHLLVIKEYARHKEHENIENYVDGISKEYAVSMSKYWSGNQVIDFVLNQKISKAEKTGIDVNVKTEPIGAIPMSESEICALFGNLLDNAIEASAKVAEGNRWIEVYLSQKRNMLFIEIANNFLEEPVFENGDPVSLKGSSHGYGIKSVKRVVGKYDGMMTYKVSNKIFRVNLSFLSFEGQRNTFQETALYEEPISCENKYSVTDKDLCYKNKDAKRGGTMKRRIVSMIFYILNLGLFLFPWIRIGEESYSVLKFAVIQTVSGCEPFIKAAGQLASEAAVMQGAISLEVFLMFVYLILSLLYMGAVVLNKKKPFNIAVLAIGVIVSYIHNTFPGTIGSLATAQMTTIFSLFFILIPAFEFFVTMIMDRWKETVKESRDYAAKEKAWKEEVKRRTAFAGKYDTPFYRIVWKNFKANWKDYILLLFCGILIIAFVVVGFGIEKIMSAQHNLEGIQMLNGLNNILTNAIIPLAVVSVFMIVMLLFYYLKCRAKNYGVFLTLGMRRKALYYFAGLEFFSVFVLSVIFGSLLGTGALVLFSYFSEALIGLKVDFAVVGVMTYVKSILVVVAVFAISAMAAKEIFVDFNVGKSTDLRSIGEPLPMRFRKTILLIGMAICGYCLWRYGMIRNFEKVRLLLGFFAGLFILIRFGMAEYLIHSRRKKKYLKRVVAESQLFHKSKSSSGYVWILTIMQVCMLFYFSFQVISPMLVQDNDTLYPYELVCIGDDEDQDIFEALENEGVEVASYPMVRVTNYDTTEKWEARGEVSPQGQHIGISESTYHELKKRLDPDYVAADLGLDAEGETVYIVHQQDKSTKAQPTDFYSAARKPILMAGLPTTGNVDVSRLSRNHDDTAFKYRTIVEEEIGSLTGVFRQGLRENIIVFSDEYFETAKGLWEITDRNTGLLTTGEYFQILFEQAKAKDDEAMKLVNNSLPRDTSAVFAEFANISQGPTTLVLVEDIPEGKMEAVQAQLDKLSERHAEEEAYDASVSSYYLKEDGIQNLQTERYMKMVMNILVIVIFMIMNIILVSIKMLSELDPKRRRADFLTCMGMYKKDRDKLIIKEVLVDLHLLPMIISMAVSLAFTFVVFYARMYNLADIQNYLKYMIPMWAAYILASTVIISILSIIYARTVEGKKYARRS